MAEPIVNLYEIAGTEGADSGITEIMDGPWREVRIVTLAAGETLSLVSDTAEHAGFVIDGGCTLTNPESSWTLTQDGAFALPLTGRADLVAGADGLVLLVVTLTVPTPNSAA